MNQAGDLPGLGENIDAHALGQLTRANNGRKGFTYTHKHSTESNREAIRSANTNGFTVNLSANTLAHADELAEINCGPVVVVLPSDQIANTTTPAGRKVVICPATVRDDITCATCGLSVSPLTVRANAKLPPLPPPIKFHSISTHEKI